MIHQPSALAIKHQELLRISSPNYEKHRSRLDDMYKKPSSRRVRILSRIFNARRPLMNTPPSSAASDNKTKFTKEYRFFDRSRQFTTNINWPKLKKKQVPNSFELSDGVAELGRDLVQHLNELGFINGTLENQDTQVKDSPESHHQKLYYCNITFTTHYYLETFDVELGLKYYWKQKPQGDIPSLFITNEQLSNYLVDKLLFNEEDTDVSNKIESLLGLASLSLHINGLEVVL